RCFGRSSPQRSPTREPAIRAGLRSTLRGRYAGGAAAVRETGRRQRSGRGARRRARRRPSCRRAAASMNALVSNFEALDTSEPYDVCIAGSDIAAGVLAVKLVRAGLRVLLVASARTAKSGEA